MQEMWETWVRLWVGKVPLEKEMVTRYSCRGNPMDREAWRLQSTESRRVGLSGWVGAAGAVPRDQQQRKAIITCNPAGIFPTAVVTNYPKLSGFKWYLVYIHGDVVRKSGCSVIRLGPLIALTRLESPHSQAHGPFWLLWGWSCF